MNSFSEERFPVDIALGASGGSGYSTDIVEMFSGHEQRNSNWSISKGIWNISYSKKTKQQIKSLVDFFHSKKGKAIGFRFKDYSDFEAIGSNIGTGDSSTTEYQLRKEYSTSEDTVYRNITKPVNGTVKIYVNGVLQTEGVDYTISYTTGLITFTTAPTTGQIITADFEFDVPVRFDADQINIVVEDPDTYSWDGINIVEIKI